MRRCGISILQNKKGAPRLPCASHDYENSLTHPCLFSSEQPEALELPAAGILVMEEAELD